MTSGSPNYILYRKRNATFSKTVVSSFPSTNSASENVIAKKRYLPCIQHHNQTAVTYGWRVAVTNVRQPPLFKVTKSKNCAYFAKKRFKPISVFESKRVDKIKSGTFMFLSTSILSKLRFYFFLRNWPFLSKRLSIIENF